jgi:hypothetical protein
MQFRPEKKMNVPSGKKVESGEIVKNHYNRMEKAIEYNNTNQDHSKISVTPENSHQIIDDFKDQFKRFKEKENWRNTDEILAKQLQIEETSKQMQQDYRVAKELAQSEAAKLLMRRDTAEPLKTGFENSNLTQKQMDWVKSPDQKDSDITAYMLDQMTDDVSLQLRKFENTIGRISATEEEYMKFTQHLLEDVTSILGEKEVGENRERVVQSNYSNLPADIHSFDLSKQASARKEVIETLLTSSRDGIAKATQRLLEVEKGRNMNQKELLAFFNDSKTYKDSTTYFIVTAGAQAKMSLKNMKESQMERSLRNTEYPINEDKNQLFRAYITLSQLVTGGTYSNTDVREIMQDIHYHFPMTSIKDKYMRHVYAFIDSNQELKSFGISTEQGTSQ